MTADFDRWALTYDASALQPAFQAAQTAVLWHARRLPRPPARVLDVGCGTGRLLRHATAMFPDSILVGVDVSAEMLSRARGSGGVGQRLVRIQASAERLPFADKTFDLIVSTASFRHWGDHGAAMLEIGRVLVPDGLFCLADLFATRRSGLVARMTGRVVLPQVLSTAIATAGLRILSANVVAGFGPIDAITVILVGGQLPSDRAQGGQGSDRGALSVVWAAPVVDAAAVAHAGFAGDWGSR